MRKSAKVVASESEKVDEAFSIPKTWKTVLVGGGSNSFHQVNPKSFDLMTADMKITDIPTIFKEKPGFNETFNNDAFARLLSCGSNMSAVVISSTGSSSSSKSKHDSIYMWGAASESNSQLQLPKIIPMKCYIQQISCGQSHIGCVSIAGEVYTWGSGNNGVLGHGNKNSVPSPKRIESLSKLKSLFISCGAFHTGIVAYDANKIKSFQLPSVDIHHHQQEYAECGTLFVCGLGKAGQLGLIENIPSSGIICTPKEVKYFTNNNLLVHKVSCGFHHTLVLTIPSDSSINHFESKIYSFGWGEHGRLGHGTEQKTNIPVEVQFSEQFNAIEISAGEQHSLAAGPLGCYSWGSNCLGQLGVGSKSMLEFSCIPVKIPFPEGTEVIQLSAGGRHSSCVSAAGKLFTWGWNEEGQLGHGSEANACYPRMCHLPSVHGKSGSPLQSISLGMAHSMALIRNPTFHYHRVEPTEVVEEVKLMPVAPVIEEVPEVVTPVKEVTEEPPPPVIYSPVAKTYIKPQIIADEDDLEEPEEDYSKFFITTKPAAETPQSIINNITNNDNHEEDEAEESMESKPKSPAPLVRLPSAPILFVQGIRELLLQREQRNALLVTPEPPPIEVEPKLAPIVIEPLPEPEVVAKSVASTSAKFNVYYKDGQQLDKCLVANSAKRAQLRKENKEKQSEKREKKVSSKKH